MSPAFAPRGDSRHSAGLLTEKVEFVVSVVSLSLLESLVSPGVCRDFELVGVALLVGKDEASHQGYFESR